MSTKQKNFVLLLSAYIAIMLGIYSVAMHDQTKRINTILDNHIVNLQTHYEIFLFNQSRFADLVYEQTVRDPEVIKLTSAAYTAYEAKDQSALDQSREQLRQHLQKPYETYKLSDLLQYHFVFPDNHVLLRMHKPSKFGDDLTSTREDFALVNQTKQIVRGFVQGRTAHAFRNDYPIFDKTGKHIATVECSFPSELLQGYLNTVSKIHSHFLVHKNVFETKAWKRDDLVLQYSPGAEHPDYLITLSENHLTEAYKTPEIHAQQSRDIVRNIKKSLFQNIDKGEKFAVFTKYQGNTKVVSFYPVTQAITGENIAWIVAYENDDIIPRIQKDTLIFLLVIALILSVIGFALFMILSQAETVRVLSERFKLALDGVNDGIWDWDILNNRAYFSPTWKHMLGYEVEDIADTPDAAFALIGEHDRQRVEQALQAHFADPENVIYALEMEMRCKDGSKKWILTRGKATLNKEGKPVRMLGSHSDISHQKKIERELMKAKNTAERASKAKSEFLANMSHEIRTPMNGIIGTASLLKETKLTGKQSKYVDMVALSGSVLLRILNDILDYSKIEAGRFTLEPSPFALKQTVNDVYELFKGPAKEKDLKLTLDYDDTIPEYLVGDYTRIRQIITNLVSNGIKYTETGSVTITVKTLDISHKKTSLKIAVTDTGPGIPPELQKTVFDKFTRVEGMTQKAVGTGLGLAICTSLIDMMGGDLGLDSTIGEGSKFWFTLSLPIAEEEEIAKIKEHSAINMNARFNANILLVEDLETNQMVVSDMLEHLGCTVGIAGNGKEALKALDSAKNKPYDLILMDCNMPIMDGFEATQAIRRRKDTPTMPIVALTANAFKEDVDKCYACGMDGFVAKPVKKEDLITALSAHLPTIHAADKSPVRQKSNPRKKPAKKKNAGKLEAWKGFDDTFIETLTTHSTEKAAKFIALTLKDSAKQIKHLKKAVKDKDAKSLGDAAHALKSISGQAGATTLSDLCQSLQVLSHDGNTDGTDELTDKILAEYNLLVAKLKHYQKKK